MEWMTFILFFDCIFGVNLFEIQTSDPDIIRYSV